MNDNRTTLMIMDSVTRVLDDARFSNSPQMSAFLRYVVVEAVAGKADRIKAYSVAVDALGKSESFDSQKDPSVRVLAMRLRESLADYYQNTVEPVVITIPRGAYKPTFTFSADGAASVAAAGGVEGNALGNPIIGLNTAFSPTAVAAQALESASNPESTERDELEPLAISMRGNSGANITGLTQLNRRQTLIWAAASVVLLFVLWFALSNRYQPPAEVVNRLPVDTLREDPQLAAAKQVAVLATAKALRVRPSLPTVHIWANAGSDELIRQIVITVSGVLSKFNNLVVIRDHAGINQVDAWPEDYVLTGSAVIVNEVIRVNAELTHVATGAIAYTTSFEATQQDGGVFTPRIIETIEAFSAQLARHDGPLISDYRQRNGIHPELTCLYDLQNQNDWNHESDRHSDYAFDGGIDMPAAHSDGCGMVPSQLDNTRLLSIMLSINLELDAAEHATTPRERQVLLDSTKTLAKQAVSLGPHRADTHAILMKTLRLTGESEQAMVHGARAMELNQFDIQFLRQYATLLVEVGESERARIVEAMTDKLNPVN